MLGNILRSQSQMNKLTDNADPVLVAVLFANTVHRQLIVAHLADTLVIRPAQHFHHVTHPKALINASDGG
ncbi:hypothetical protein D3C75_466370 [compost metagenome]